MFEETSRKMLRDYGRISLTELQLLNIKRFKHDLIELVLDAYKKDSIRLYHSEDPKELSPNKAIPYELHYFPKERRVRALINLTPYHKKIERIQETMIYALMESALMSLILTNPQAWNSLKNNTRLVNSSASIYIDLCQTVIDKRLMAGFNEETTDQLRYILGIYFAQHMLSLVSDSTVSDLAYSRRRFNTDRTTISQLDGILDREKLNIGLVETISQIRLALPSLSSLSVKSFVSDWGSRYDESTVFALEYFPYFIYMINSTYLVSHQVNVKPIAKSTDSTLIKKFTSNMHKLVRDHYNAL